MQDTVYAACNLMTIILVMVKMLVLLVNNEKLLELIHYAETNFWHTNYDSYELKIVITVIVFVHFSFASSLSSLREQLLVSC